MCGWKQWPSRWTTQNPFLCPTSNEECLVRVPTSNAFNNEGSILSGDMLSEIPTEILLVNQWRKCCHRIVGAETPDIHAGKEAPLPAAPWVGKTSGREPACLVLVQHSFRPPFFWLPLAGERQKHGLPLI